MRGARQAIAAFVIGHAGCSSPPHSDAVTVDETREVNLPGFVGADFASDISAVFSSSNCADDAEVVIATLPARQARKWLNAGLLGRPSQPELGTPHLRVFIPVDESQASLLYVGRKQSAVNVRALLRAGAGADVWTSLREGEAWPYPFDREGLKVLSGSAEEWASGAVVPSSEDEVRLVSCPSNWFHLFLVRQKPSVR